MTNTRMEDFFDLWVLLHDTALDDAELPRAIEAAFARRQTAMPGTPPIGLSDAFFEDATKQEQRPAFLKKNRLEVMALGEVIRHVRGRAGQFGFARTWSSRQTSVRKAQSLSMNPQQMRKPLSAKVHRCKTAS